MGARMINAHIKSMKKVVLAGDTVIDQRYGDGLYIGTVPGNIEVSFRVDPTVFIVIPVSDFMTTHLKLAFIRQSGTTATDLYALSME